MEKMINQYLAKNYNNFDWFNGVTPERLKNLKGQIKKLDQKEYHLKYKKNQLEESILIADFVLIFNEKFEIIKKIEHLGKSKITYKNFIKNQVARQEWSDENGILIQYEVYEFRDGLDCAINFYAKNSDGTENETILNIENLNNDSFIYHGRYFDDYYTKGVLIESISNYNPIIKMKYEYFNDYYIKFFYSNDKIERTESYNENKFLSELKIFDEKGNLKRKEIRKYDVSNNIIEILTSSNENEKPFPERFIYNELNQLIEKRELSKEFQFQTVRLYEYDEKGNLKEEKGNWNNAIFEYKYDENENWVERTEIKNSKVFSKTIRVIEYH